MQAQRSTASEAMDRYADGDEAVFAELYRLLSPRLRAFLMRLVRNEALADDLLQQTFLQMHVARARFVRGARVEPWAYTIARAVSMDHLRREYRRGAREKDSQAMGRPAPEPMDALVSVELSEALQEELRHLTPAMREAFLLVHVDGLTHAEAAAVLGIEESATKVRTHRARSWLRERLTRFQTRGNQP